MTLVFIPPEMTACLLSHYFRPLSEYRPVLVILLTVNPQAAGLNMCLNSSRN